LHINHKAEEINKKQIYAGNCNYCIIVTPPTELQHGKLDRKLPTSPIRNNAPPMPPKIVDQIAYQT
jgi:hypothetical protein